MSNMVKDSLSRRLESIFLFTWVFVMLSTALKSEVYPRIEWLATLSLLPFVIYKAFSRGELLINKFYMIAVFAFFILTLPSLWFGEHFFYNFQESIKLLIILSLPCLLSGNDDYIRVCFFALVAAAIINFLLILFSGFLGLHSLAAVWAYTGRWSTILTGPGELGRLGLGFFVLSATLFLFVNHFKFKVYSLLSAFIAIFLVIWDGGRTEMLGILLSIMTVIGFYGYLIRKTRVSFSFLCPTAFFSSVALLICLIIGSTVLANQFTSLVINFSKKNMNLVFFKPLSSRYITVANKEFEAQESHVRTIENVLVHQKKPQIRLTSNARVASLSLYNNRHASNTLKSYDPIRYEQYRSGLGQLYSRMSSEILSKDFFRFLFGAGFDQSYAEVNIKNSYRKMDIANSYLSVFMRYGLFGFVDFCFLMFGWVLFLKNIFTRDFFEASPKHFFLIISSVSLLIYFNVFSFFCEFSTEFSEWIFYVLPISVLMRYLEPALQLRRQGEA